MLQLAWLQASAVQLVMPSSQPTPLLRCADPPHQAAGRCTVHPQPGGAAVVRGAAGPGGWVGGWVLQLGGRSWTASTAARFAPLHAFEPRALLSGLSTWPSRRWRHGRARMRPLCASPLMPATFSATTAHASCTRWAGGWRSSWAPHAGWHSTGHGLHRRLLLFPPVLLRTPAPCSPCFPLSSPALPRCASALPPPPWAACCLWSAHCSAWSCSCACRPWCWAPRWRRSRRSSTTPPGRRAAGGGGGGGGGAGSHFRQGLGLMRQGRRPLVHAGGLAGGLRSALLDQVCHRCAPTCRRCCK